MKSPIKKKPLHNPGESLDKEIENIWLDIFQYLVVTLIIVSFAALEWWRFYAKTPPSPYVISVFALISICVTIWQVRKKFKRVRNLQQGLKGEKSVGQFLDCLRENGAKVFHDILVKDLTLITL